MSSSYYRKREVTARMWSAAPEDCSRSERQRLEKLGRCRLRVECGEQTARETKRNEDAFETPTLLDDEVHRRDMTVPGREEINKKGQLEVYPPRDGQQDIYKKRTTSLKSIHQEMVSQCSWRIGAA